MFVPIPIGDEPNPPQVAWATYTLMAINVAIFVLVTLPARLSPAPLHHAALTAYIDVMARVSGQTAQQILRETSLYDLIVFRWGFRPSAPSLVSLVTAQFLHAGLLHLGGNMLYLYIFGDNVEAKLGRVRFVAMYLGAGIAATLFYAMTRHHSELPLIGASGAISGILGCYYIWFAFNRVRLLLIIFVFITTVSVPARLVLMFYFIVENLLPFLYEVSLKGGVAYGAHVGGFVAGALFARLNSGPVRTHAGDGPSHPAQSIKTERQAHTEALARTFAEAPLSVALDSYQRATGVARTELLASEIFVLVDRLTEAGEFDQALAILNDFLAQRRDAAGLWFGRAHMRAGYLYLRGLSRPDKARQHFLAALEAGPEDGVARAAHEALSQCEAPR